MVTKPVKKSLDNSYPFRVTGVMMQYYAVCKRELWFEYNNIEIDRCNKHIVKGTLVDDNTYDHIDRETLRLGPIAPDMSENGKIVEIKPSKSYKRASRLQLYYYLWYLEEKYDIKKDGVLAYPKQKERNEISLDKNKKDEIESIISDIYKIVMKDKPPKFEEKDACSSCAFKDFCWLGVSN